MLQFPDRHSQLKKLSAALNKKDSSCPTVAGVLVGSAVCAIMGGKAMAFSSISDSPLRAKMRPRHFVEAQVGRA